MLYTSKRNGDQFQVIETKEDKVVYITDNGKTARKQTHFLNSGGGFAGDTPNFFHKVVALAS